MNQSSLAARVGLGLLLGAGLFGCGRGPVEVAPPEKPVVPVSHPVTRVVTDYLYFTGQTAAINAVDIRARVTGYLQKMPFREGAEVREDDLLFVIDPRPYKAQYDQAKSQIALYEAKLELAQTTLERDRLAGKAVSRQQIDQDVAAVREAQAGIEAAKSSLEVYDLNLKFTKVRSPISGQVGRYYLTPGNLINQDQTLLTTVVSLDPIYVYFDLEETNLVRIRMAINEGRIKLPQAAQQDLPGFAAATLGMGGFPGGTSTLGQLAALVVGTSVQVPVEVGLQVEEGYPHQGYINFVNNQVNPATGSIAVRAILRNPKGKGGARLFAPGMFVRVRMPLGSPHPATLVIDRAVQSDQGLKYVYVLDKNNKVQQRRVTLGALQDDGLRVIEPGEKKGEGVRRSDWVVVGAVLQLRPRMVVEPEQVPMPTLGQGAVSPERDMRR
jgi:multidrug efflux system membrane fusion protein